MILWEGVFNDIKYIKNRLVGGGKGVERFLVGNIKFWEGVFLYICYMGILCIVVKGIVVRLLSVG